MPASSRLPEAVVGRRTSASTRQVPVAVAVDEGGDLHADQLRASFGRSVGTVHRLLVQPGQALVKLEGGPALGPDCPEPGLLFGREIPALLNSSLLGHGSMFSHDWFSCWFIEDGTQHMHLNR